MKSITFSTESIGFRSRSSIPETSISTAVLHDLQAPVITNHHTVRVIDSLRIRRNLIYFVNVQWKIIVSRQEVCISQQKNS